MIDGNGNRLYLMHGSPVALSSTGIKVRYGPVYVTSIARLRGIVYMGTSTSANLAVTIQDEDGTAYTNAINLPVSTANVAYFRKLTASDFTSASKQEVKKGNIYVINVTTAGAGNGYIGLVVD